VAMAVKKVAIVTNSVAIKAKKVAIAQKV